MTAVRYTSTNRHHQGWDHDRLIMIAGQKVRVQVHHDTSYANQSRAHADVWTPAEGGGGSWNHLTSVHYGEDGWAERTRPEKESMLWAAGELERRAALILEEAPMT